MRILFLTKDRNGEFKVFSFGDMEKLRGIERGTLHLAEALAKRGHNVVLAMPVTGKVAKYGVSIVHPETALLDSYDVAISNNLATAFNGVRASAKILWMRNPGFRWVHLRADFLAKLRYRPRIVHLSKYTRDRSWFLPQSGNTIIHHGVPSALLERIQDRPSHPPPVAMFCSFGYRNLAWVIDAWRTTVRKALPEARLEVTATVKPEHIRGLTRRELEELNISVVGSLPWTELMDRMQKARVLLVPGHPHETYNNLVVEAAACGLPAVTMGIGALGERVLHDETGWVASSVRDLGLATVRLLQDDALWRRYSQRCQSHSDLVSWDDRAETWEKYISGFVRKPVMSTCWDVPSPR